MANEIKRGESLFIPFRNGKSIHDSQCKPRIYKTRKGFEKHFPGHYLGNDGVELVEYSEVVRCKDCKHGIWDEENEMWKCVESADYDEDAGEWFGFYEYHNGDFFCADGERKDNGQTERKAD